MTLKTINMQWELNQVVKVTQATKVTKSKNSKDNSTATNQEKETCPTNWKVSKANSTTRLTVSEKWDQKASPTVIKR